MPAIRGGHPGDLISRYAYLGSSVPGVLLGLFTHPQLVLLHVFSPGSLIAIATLLGGLAFLPLARPLAAAAALPALALELLSSHPAQSTLLDQYGLQPGPLLFIAALLGWARIAPRFKASPGVSLLARTLVSLVLAAARRRAMARNGRAARVPPHLLRVRAPADPVFLRTYLVFGRRRLFGHRMGPEPRGSALRRRLGQQAARHLLAQRLPGRPPSGRDGDATGDIGGRRRRCGVRCQHRDQGWRRRRGDDRGSVICRRGIAADPRWRPLQRRAVRRRPGGGGDRHRAAFLEASMVDRRRGPGRPGSALQRGLRGRPGCGDGSGAHPGRARRRAHRNQLSRGADHPLAPPTL